jgi:DUF3102 family protein
MKKQNKEIARVCTIGRKLWEQKQKLARGQWRRWVWANMRGLSYETAIKYVRLYEHKEEVLYCESKSDAYRKLGLIKS